MSRFADKVALVTGGTQGMGLTVATALAREGAVVVICGRDRGRGEAAAAHLREQGPNAKFVGCDIADSDSVQAMIDGVVRDYGRIDCAFNNAGVTSEHARVGESSADNWRHVVDINLNGTYHCMKYEIRAMTKSGGGVIVNNSSVAGLMAIPNQAGYVATKHAIVGLTRAAAIEYAQAQPGESAVRINAIAPGPIMGGMNDDANLKENPERTRRKVGATAMRRFGRAEEVASTVLWLLSDEASYVTGGVIPIDGGATSGKF